MKNAREAIHQYRGAEIVRYGVKVPRHLHISIWLFIFNRNRKKLHKLIGRGHLLIPFSIYIHLYSVS